MDDLDAALLREMFRKRVLLWGGGDPRLGATGLAERLGVDRTTVWARLRAWRAAGFLVRQEVVPNPSLFGAGIAGGDVRVDDPRRKPAVLESLGLVDGVLAAVDQVGPYVLLLYAHDTASALDRCTRLVRRLPGVDDVSMCIPFDPPRSAVEPTATDWRILRALRRAPDRPLREVAEEAGVSARTLTRRYAELLEASAIWSFPVLDFARYRGAVLARFVVSLAQRDGAASLVNRCRRGLPQMVWWDAPAPAVPDPDGHAWVDVHCHLSAAAEVEAVHAWLLDAPGIEGVEVFFPKSWTVLPAWFDERIAARMRAVASPGRLRAPKAR